MKVHASPISLSALTLTVLLAGCSSTLMTENATDPASGAVPTVSAVAEQVNGVAPNRKQEVQFSEAMDASTINAKTFTVTDSSGNAVSGAVTYDASYDIASFQPNPALQTGATYTVTVTTGVASTGGEHLAAAYSYTFTTRATTDTSPLAINSVDPAAGATCVSATAPIIITFNEAPDASTVNSTNIVVTGPGATVIPVTMSINVTTTQVVLTPNSALSSGTITVTVQNVGDLADVMMTAAYTWTFSTECGGGGGSGSGNEYLYFGAGVEAGTPEFYGYAIDSATGVLTPVPGGPFQVSVGATPSPCGGGCNLDPLADPLGRFLFYNFIQTPNQHGVGTMKVDPTTGALTNDNVLTYVPDGTSVSDIYYVSADPKGRYIYGTGVLYSPGPSGSDLLMSITVGADGTLSFTPGQPYQLPEGNNSVPPQAPAATDQYVFVSDPALDLEGAQQPSDIFTYTLDQSSGALTATSTAYQVGVGAGEEAITPSGKFLYIETNQLLSSGFPGPAELRGYQVNADGTLTPIAQAPIQSPQQPAIITMSPNGNFLYISGVIYPSTPGGPSTIDNSAYAIDPNTGALTLTADYTNIPSTLLTIDPAVKYVYIPESTNTTPIVYTMAGFSVNPTNGALTPLPGPATVLPTNPGIYMPIVRPQ
ncbi:exported hypothetical protein [Candidatus Sulfotelmatomonas gaucii]|uniref:SbsA Ig-like domain-containing protein n=1 Tax=Candidatus Sulfuritelmatomonas gaucii TaxID=2043161 RepID=A0A2N9LJN8_9BACT|nr:exported hypothetical protein [Candidatus Sulfotelmatomonas gaucii]